MRATSFPQQLVCRPASGDKHVGVKGLAEERTEGERRPWGSRLLASDQSGGGSERRHDCELAGN